MLKRLSTSFLIIVVSLFFAAAPAFAANETVTASDGTVIPVLDREEYSRRVEAFVNDARWQDEAAWANGERPKSSPWRAVGCAAYACDFAKEIYGSDKPRTGISDSGSASQIQTGDIVHVYYSSGDHWFVVLQRMGDLLYTAEGAYGGKVQIETGFYIVSGDTLVARYGTDYEIAEAYHYPITE